MRILPTGLITYFAIVLSIFAIVYLTVDYLQHESFIEESAQLRFLQISRDIINECNGVCDSANTFFNIIEAYQVLRGFDQGRALELNMYLMPYMKQYSYITSINLGNSEGVGNSEGDGYLINIPY